MWLLFVRFVFGNVLMRRKCDEKQWFTVFGQREKCERKKVLGVQILVESMGRKNEESENDKFIG